MDMPYRTKAFDLLALWREAEREYEAAPEMDQRIALGQEMERLRSEYEATILAAREAALPEPPPFPADRPAALRR
jgi:hypothetical protein